jgi:hypothetical protein
VRWELHGCGGSWGGEGRGEQRGLELALIRRSIAHYRAECAISCAATTDLVPRNSALPARCASQATLALTTALHVLHHQTPPVTTTHPIPQYDARAPFSPVPPKHLVPAKFRPPPQPPAHGARTINAHACLYNRAPHVRGRSGVYPVLRRLCAGSPSVPRGLVLLPHALRPSSAATRRAPPGSVSPRLDADRLYPRAGSARPFASTVPSPLRAQARPDLTSSRPRPLPRLADSASALALAGSGSRRSPTR